MSPEEFFFQEAALAIGAKNINRAKKTLNFWMACTSRANRFLGRSEYIGLSSSSERMFGSASFLTQIFIKSSLEP